jgi:hypothetical protein
MLNNCAERETKKCRKPLEIIFPKNRPLQMLLFALSEQDISQNFLFHKEHHKCRRALPPHSSKNSQFRLPPMQAVRGVQRSTCSNRLSVGLDRFRPCVRRADSFTSMQLCAVALLSKLLSRFHSLGERLPVSLCRVSNRNFDIGPFVPFFSPFSRSTTPLAALVSCI